MSKSSESVKLWRKNLKNRAIKLFNEKCNICGYDKCPSALEFHHLDPTQKDFQISDAYRNPKSWDSIVSELRKCIMVCANCHREIHEGIVEIEYKQYLNDVHIDYRIEEGTHKLCICGTVISNSKIFCSQECDRKSRRILDWDHPLTIENILNLKDNENKSFVHIAKLFDTSDKTVAKWYRRYKSGIAQR